MIVFLPAADAGRLGIGEEARVILDAVPDYVIPAEVSFVASESQFTPKTVETKDERAKLMFRVELRIDRQVLKTYYGRLEGGLTGSGFVRTRPDAKWPAELEIKLPPAPASPPVAETPAPAATSPIAQNAAPAAAPAPAAPAPAPAPAPVAQAAPPAAAPAPAAPAPAPVAQRLRRAAPRRLRPPPRRSHKRRRPPRLLRRLPRRLRPLPRPVAQTAPPAAAPAPVAPPLRPLRRRSRRRLRQRPPRRRPRSSSLLRASRSWSAPGLRPPPTATGCFNGEAKRWRIDSRWTSLRRPRSSSRSASACLPQFAGSRRRPAKAAL